VPIQSHNYTTYLSNLVPTVIILSTHHTNRESLPAYLCLARPSVCVCV